MKANEYDETAYCWNAIITALNACAQAQTWAYWRDRYASPHPDQQEGIVDARQYAKANWFAAKHLYLNHKEAIDLYYKSRAYGNDSETFKMMTKVIDREMAENMEKILTNSEPDIAWEGDDVVTQDDDLFTDPDTKD